MYGGGRFTRANWASRVWWRLIYTCYSDTTGIAKWHLHGSVRKHGTAAGGMQAAIVVISMSKNAKLLDHQC